MAGGLRGTGYPSLADHRWPLGVRRNRLGYGHPWLVVLPDRTVGFYSRREAATFWQWNRPVSSEKK